MTVTAIVQARIASTRLPGKVMRSIIGKPVLQHVIERIKMSKSVDQVVVATTENAEDYPLCAIAMSMGELWFRGSEDDVLGRVTEASANFQSDIIVDITADCPFVDPDMIDNLVHVYRDNIGRLDYVSNVLPPTWPNGFDIQVYDYETLRFLSDNVEGELREHTGWNARNYKRELRTKNVPAPEKYTHPEVRVTLDTPEDFTVIKTIFESFGDNKFSAEDLMEFLFVHPELTMINGHIVQSDPEDKI